MSDKKVSSEVDKKPAKKQIKEVKYKEITVPRGKKVTDNGRVFLPGKHKARQK